uniref:Uncharacterized protein n=1 Tax=Chromera velia CCMP2878 TaxID=1169474 RepID=A0A0G4G5X4_9ALVE|mmetsp:Transcript_7813/g.15217  ORF Transcript_7813/g.15217 Transcript_7813/m.15217 type:complete len:150 (-) Transcript_7813:525-974(-)|eukprot:Cvel_4212.t1-p1 / transcript=Cvel_4212.t1 / gene=Cvel_4212 / organism=Chromera_velia_CCMP2878 / gene_product=hypothetical protein / transcript_product=hypothetical protein / location=Cvel_scaffold182:21947-22792(-) / protein_length=149 / sequence_SO=supercontig / SO=protein_coding / is_pseudo=false
MGSSPSSLVEQKGEMKISFKYWGHFNDSHDMKRIQYTASGQVVMKEVMPEVFREKGFSADEWFAMVSEWKEMSDSAFGRGTGTCVSQHIPLVSICMYIRIKSDQFEADLESWQRHFNSQYGSRGMTVSFEHVETGSSKQYVMTFKRTDI